MEQRTALRQLGYLYFKNNSTPICKTIGSNYVIGCSCAQTTTIIYLRTVYLRINLRLNNIFCYCLNFAFLSLLIIKLSTHKSVSGYLWYKGEIERGGNTATSWYTSRGIWQKMEDNRTSDKELLMARNYEGSGKIYRWM